MSKDVAVERARLEQEASNGSPASRAAALIRLKQLNDTVAGPRISPEPEQAATLGLRISPPKVGAGELRLPLIGGIK